MTRNHNNPSGRPRPLPTEPGACFYARRAFYAFFNPTDPLLVWTVRAALLALVLVGVVGLVSGCSQPRPSPSPSPRPAIQQAGKQIAEVASATKDHTSAIRAETQTIRQVAPDATPHADEIDKHAISIDQQASRLTDETAPTLKRADLDSGLLEAERDRLAAEVDRLTAAERRAALTRYLWMVTIGTGIIALGIGLMFLGRIPAGLAAMAAGGTLIAVGRFLQVYDWLMPWIGGGVLLAGVTFACWHGWRNRTAAKEVIREIDSVIRPMLTVEQWERVKDALRRDQCPTTKSVVDELGH